MGEGDWKEKRAKALRNARIKTVIEKFERDPTGISTHLNHDLQVASLKLTPPKPTNSARSTTSHSKI